MWPFTPSPREKFRQGLASTGKYLLSAGGIVAGATIASRIADIVMTRKLQKSQAEHAQELRDRDDKAMQLQQSTLQNQVITAKILDDLAHRLSTPTNSHE
jgi:hypothetical protein